MDKYKQGDKVRIVNLSALTKSFSTSAESLAWKTNALETRAILEISEDQHDDYDSVWFNNGAIYYKVHEKDVKPVKNKPTIIIEEE